MRLLSFLPAILGLTSAVSVPSILRARQSTACNNSPSLCGKSYGSVVHLGCHDSPFVRDSTTGFSTSGNQYYNSTVQLSAGVRMLTAQVHKNNNGWHLCHSSCDLLDAGLLSDWLKSIKTWMDANPNEVVTILLVNSDSATGAQLHNEFLKSAITSYAYTPPVGRDATISPSAWPTLQALISANTRLMVFVASVDSSSFPDDAGYMMNEFPYIFENNYNNVNPSDFSCDVNRPSGLDTPGAVASRLALMNHFLDKSYGSGIETPDVDKITTTNSPNSTTVGQLGYAADTCNAQYGRPPTFILVDFFDEGPALQTVDRLNGVTNPIGRSALPPRPTHTAGNSASWAGVQLLVEQVNNGETPSLGAWIYGAGKWSWGGINLSGGQVLS